MIDLATPAQHVIFIVQENRSFDSYFGTYPGAAGLPAGIRPRTGVPIRARRSATEPVWS